MPCTDPVRALVIGASAMTDYQDFTKNYLVAQNVHDERSAEVKSFVGAILAAIQHTRHPHLAKVGAHNNVRTYEDCGWAIERRPDGKIHAQCYQWPEKTSDPFHLAYTTDPTWIGEETWIGEDMDKMDPVAGMKFARKGLHIFVRGMCEHTFFPDLEQQLAKMFAAL